MMISAGQRWEFRGSVHTIHSVDQDSGIAWLIEDGDTGTRPFSISTVAENGKEVLNGDSLAITKREVEAHIDALKAVLDLVDNLNNSIFPENRIPELRKEIVKMIDQAEVDREMAVEDIFSSVIRSHKAICAIKKMDEKAAYGWDPAIYYTCGVAAEGGEMLNKVVKAMRDGGLQEKLLKAIKSELPDVIIYSFVLAYVLEIDLMRLVNEKVEVVIKRAENGHYGGPLPSSPPDMIKRRPEGTFPYDPDMIDDPSEYDIMCCEDLDALPRPARRPPDSREFHEFPLSGTKCSVCGEPQRNTPSGLLCAKGHGGAPPK